MTSTPLTSTPVTSTPSILTGSDLVKTYGTTRALGGVSLDVRAGEAVAIMGASGSGKTTLLHVLAGILPPDAGTVALNGRTGPIRIDGLGERERSRLRREEFGFVFQQGLLIPELTAVENVALPLLLTGHARGPAEAHAAQWLAALGLAGMEQRRIGQLSGGQAQRVAIARAQATGARILFADEPTGALDSATSAEVMTALLESTLSRGNALVVVTHDPQVAARCTRVIRMQDGLITGETVAAQASGTEVAR
ncbi:ABC transporter ATP-binding protein [Microbacterium paludicola]|uniref:ABC transporter ATP-binding protein n=1 Tax=Microbacterium paludicola TaxID=300019 RepID=UPI0031D0A11F